MSNPCSKMTFQVCQNIHISYTYIRVTPYVILENMSTYSFTYVDSILHIIAHMSIHDDILDMCHICHQHMSKLCYICYFLMLPCQNLNMEVGTHLMLPCQNLNMEVGTHPQVLAHTHRCWKKCSVFTQALLVALHFQVCARGVKTDPSGHLTAG